MLFSNCGATQTLGVPKSLKDPHITRDPYLYPQGYGDQGPQIGGPPFHADTGSINFDNMKWITHRICCPSEILLLKYFAIEYYLKNF